ncbi:unnamed protein product [Brassica oleracea var. botrytis]
MAIRPTCVIIAKLICGKVKLPLLRAPPTSLLKLLYNKGEMRNHFREFIRAYNMMLFTSLGGKVNNSINNGAGPYLFQLCGENYHLIGDMLPGPGKNPAFLQLYIHDTANEISNRMAAYGRTGSTEKIKRQIVEILKNMLDANSCYVGAFRSARERLEVSGAGRRMRLVLASGRSTDGRTYNLPTENDVAALIPGDFEKSMENRDIILESSTGKLQRISELHPAYLPSQYPLLVPFGEDGFRLGIDIGFLDKKGRKRKTITMREFFAFRIQERFGESPIILMSGRLFQQLLVDAYTKIESNRHYKKTARILCYIWLNQKNLRSEHYDKIVDASAKGKGDLSAQGKRIYIPSSFTGGKRYMMQHYLDAMATCKYYGYPDFFITITCNPKWPEITRYLQKHDLKTEDRPDICCRVFKMKLDNLVDYLMTGTVLGEINSGKCLK